MKVIPPVATVAPLVPVTISAYPAACEVVTVVATVTVEVCAAPSTTEVGFNVQVGVDDSRIAGGLTLHVSATVPVNPFVGVTVIVDVAEVPATIMGLFELELMVKLGTTAATTATETPPDAGETK